jgi:hypothetical protein
MEDSFSTLFPSSAELSKLKDVERVLALAVPVLLWPTPLQVEPLVPKMESPLKEPVAVLPVAQMQPPDEPQNLWPDSQPATPPSERAAPPSEQSLTRAPSYPSRSSASPLDDLLDGGSQMCGSCVGSIGMMMVECIEVGRQPLITDQNRGSIHMFFASPTPPCCLVLRRFRPLVLSAGVCVANSHQRGSRWGSRDNKLKVRRRESRGTYCAESVTLHSFPSRSIWGSSHQFCQVAGCRLKSVRFPESWGLHPWRLTICVFFVYSAHQRLIVPHLCLLFIF